MEAIIGIGCIFGFAIVTLIWDYKRMKAYQAKEAAQMEMYQAIKSHLEHCS